MAENVANSINDLHGPMLGILTIDQVCSECSSGVHPPIPSGLSGILNSFGWLTAVSSDEPRGSTGYGCCAACVRASGLGGDFKHASLIQRMGHAPCSASRTDRQARPVVAARWQVFGTVLRIRSSEKGSAPPLETRRAVTAKATQAPAFYIPIMTLHVSGRGERANSNAFTAWSNENRSVTS